MCLLVSKMRVTVSIMRYDIHYSPATKPLSLSQYKVGIEIQPPLHPGAITGVLNELVRIDKGHNMGPAAASANHTRQDEEGTVIVVGNPNHHRGLTDPKALALFVGTIIDPCSMHDVQCHGHDS